LTIALLAGNGQELLKRPGTVVTEARGARHRHLHVAYLADLGAIGVVVVHRSADRWR
jgi:hypothetical protein